METVAFSWNVGRQSIGDDFGGSCLISFATSSVVTCSKSCSTGRCAEVTGDRTGCRLPQFVDILSRGLVNAIAVPIMCSRLDSDLASSVSRLT